MQLKVAENPELFCPYFIKLFNFIIEKNIKTENIYNMGKKNFLVGRNRY